MSGVAAVTGLGVIAPNGIGTPVYWSAVLARHSGIRRIARFDVDGHPSPLAGEIDGFEPRDYLPGRLLAQTDPMTQYALAAADWALDDAGLDRSEPLEHGVVTASASGGFDFGQNELQNLWSKGPDHVSAYMSFAWFYAVNTGQISIRHDLRGPTSVIVTEQAGGLDAIAHARRKITGGARLMVTGAMDSSLCPYGMAAQIKSGRLSKSDDPAAAFLPFDRRANGHVPGEGGAILTVEDPERARLRGARIYGEIIGYGASFDPPPWSGRAPNLVRAITAALAEARVAPQDIAMVIADSAAVPELDRTEADALVAVFGADGVPVTVPKALTGRLYSGAGALDVVTALLALQDGLIPPTANVSEIDRTLRLDLVVEPRATDGDAVLVVARGFSGFNSAMVIRRAG